MWLQQDKNYAKGPSTKKIVEEYQIYVHICLVNKTTLKVTTDHMSKNGLSFFHKNDWRLRTNCCKTHFISWCVCHTTLKNPSSTIVLQTFEVFEDENWWRWTIFTRNYTWSSFASPWSFWKWKSEFHKKTSIGHSLANDWSFWRQRWSNEGKSKILCQP